MKDSPIICYGDELFSVLADLREHGAVVESLDTMVSGNSGYRINYFAGESGSTPDGSINPRKATEHEPLKNVAGPVVAVEHAGNSDFERMAEETQSAPGRTRNSGHAGPDALPTISPHRGFAMVGSGESIEARMARLYEKAVASGSLKKQPSRKPAGERHVRLPYPND